MWFWKRRLRRRTDPAILANPPRTSREAIERCIHGEESRKFTVMVHGTSCEFESSQICAGCLEAYLNVVSTICASCLKPILPGTPIGAAWIDAPHPHTHDTAKCGQPGFSNGIWGEGRHLKLGEVYDFVEYAGGTALIPKNQITL